MSHPHSLLQLQRKAENWNSIKCQIFTRLYETITDTAFEQCWLPVSDLFAKKFGTIPDGISLQAFSSAIWGNKRNMREPGNGTFVHIHTLTTNEWGIIMRYKFGSTSCLRVQRGTFSGVDTSHRRMRHSACSEPNWLEISNDAILDGRCGINNINSMEKIRDRLKDIWNNGSIDLPSPGQYSTHEYSGGSINQKTRSDIALDSLMLSKSRYHNFNRLSTTMQASIIQKLLAFYEDNNSNDLECDKEITAFNLLNFFKHSGKSFSNEHFVRCFTSKSKGGRKLFPTSDGLNNLGKTNKSRMLSLMRDIAQYSAECLVGNKDDAPQLLKMMLESTTFATCVLPEASSASKKDQFKNNPVVKNIKEAVAIMANAEGDQTHRKQEQKEQLVSLLTTKYPQIWIREYLGVGRVTTRSAHDRAVKFGPGVPLPDFARKSITRPGRATGETADFTRNWFQSKDNTEASPIIQRDSFSGNLVTKPKFFRMRNRNCGYKKYCNDARTNGIDPYSRTKFYQLNDELGIVDPKSDAALCPSCHKLGTENYAKLRKVVAFIYPDQNDSKFIIATNFIKEMQEYFARGGKFYHSLHKTSECIDWCLRYQLSDPFDESLQCECSMHDTNQEFRHQHKIRDAIVEKKDQFFDEILSDAYVKQGSRKITLNMEMASGKVEGEVIWIRHGVARIRLQDGATKDMRWDELTSELNRDDFNHLTVVDYLQRVITTHKNYLRHLYLDRNQTYGELMVLRDNESVGVMDYCMKLRAKSWASDTSKFHLYMNKGTSVHVFCLKSRVTQTVVDLGIEKGDYQIIWIDSFCSNTTQGGYDTLCVIEADLKAVGKLMPGINKIGLLSDAGSGYKTAQCILAMRDAEKLTGCRVTFWHFNASGEGKRWETDGHNTTIKVRREQAMQAGSPSDCTTPRNEVLAQVFDGGSVGTYPVLLEYDYGQMEQMVKQPWKGLQKFHDFEFIPDGSIRVWRSYAIGPGKVFSKIELDKNYEKYAKDSTRLQENKFPQMSTGSSFTFSPKSANQFITKTEPSPKRKRELKKEKAQIKKRKYQKAHETMNKKIGVCDGTFEDEFASDNVINPNNDGFFSQKEEIFKTPDTNEVGQTNIKHVPMGGGLNLFRSSGCTEKGIEIIIKAEIEKGFKNAGSRKSVLEMYATCKAKVPTFMMPDLNEIQSLVSQILAKSAEKHTRKRESSSESRKESTKKQGARIPKTEKEKKQEEAGSLRRNEGRVVGDKTKRHLFYARYSEVCLIGNDGETRIITDVYFSENENGKKSFWTVKAEKTKPHEFDDRVEVVLSSDADPTYIKIDGKLTKSIRKYNEYYKSLIPCPLC